MNRLVISGVVVMAVAILMFYMSNSVVQEAQYRTDDVRSEVDLAKLFIGASYFVGMLGTALMVVGLVRRK